MLKIILAETELEPVPAKMRGDRSLRKAFEKKDTVILDSNFHHTAMRGLKDSYRRGRPDIAHVCLLNALDSPLNHKGGMEFYIHTRNDQVIEMAPDWRVPRSYNRFIGLMEKLFETRNIEHDGKTLLKMTDCGLEELIERVSVGCDVKLMHYEGDSYEPSDESVVIIGGFPHGDFNNSLDYPRYSIYSEEIMAWSVLNHVIYTL